MRYHAVSRMISVSACMEPLLLMLDDESLAPALKKSQGGAAITLGDCAAEVAPMDDRVVLTSVTVPSASEPHTPLLLLLAAEYAAGAGHELFVPQESGCADAFGEYDICSVRDGVCAGRPGSLVVYMGPKLLKRKRRKARDGA